MIREYTEKDRYFIRRIKFIDNIKRAIDLTNEGKYEKSNEIYNQLLNHREQEDTKQYLDLILANKGWNFIELGLYSRALECFLIGRNINPLNDLIKDGIFYIEECVRMIEE